MRRVVFLCVLCALCRSIRSEPLAMVCLTDDQDEIQDLIYLGASTPIFVRLRIRIDGRGLYAQRLTWAAQLFDKLDTSGDGVLTGAEIETIPPAGHVIPVGGSNSTATVPNFAPPDADKNGQVIREELTAFILAASGAPFQIHTENQQSADDQPVPLFERLDINHDKQLTADELSQAARRLRSLDMDLDGRIAADEIRISKDDENVQQNSNSVNNEALTALAMFEPINRNYADDALIRRIVQKYDKLARGPSSRRFTKDGRLSAAELGQEVSIFAASDRNNDMVLDQQELQGFLTNLQPATEILIEFGGDSSSSCIELLKRGDLPQSAMLGIDTDEKRHVIVRLGRTLFKLAVTSQPVMSHPDRFSIRFKDIDRDRNDFLDRDEFGRTEGLTANHFRLVDTDGDEKVIEKEFTSFINLQAELQQHIVSLELGGSGQSLFRIIDSSGDGRLDTGELSALQRRIIERDSNQDGVVSEDELPNGFQMILSRGTGR